MVGQMEGQMDGWTVGLGQAANRAAFTRIKRLCHESAAATVATIMIGISLNFFTCCHKGESNMFKKSVSTMRAGTSS